MKKKAGWDCNKDGCPGMAHPCTRIPYFAAKKRADSGEASQAIQEALRVQCQRFESDIEDLKAELLEAYRKINREDR